MVKNIARLVEAWKALTNRGHGTPGIGLVRGRTGDGKSTAITWLGVQENAVSVRANALWTPSSMLTAICIEIGIPVRQSNAIKLSDIIGSLARSRRPLIVDEADYLADSKKLTETLRDIHDISTVPVILVGMSDLHHKLRNREQLTNRIAQEVVFRGTEMDDARKVATQLCEVKVGDDLLQKLHKDADKSIRRVVVGLHRIEHYARARGLRAMNLKDWPSGSELFTGKAPVPVKAAGRTDGGDDAQRSFDDAEGSEAAVAS